MKICETVQVPVALVWLYISERVALYVSVSGCMYLNRGVKGLEVELYVLQVAPLCCVADDAVRHGVPAWWDIGYGMG